jgi:hypothetical protein
MRRTYAGTASVTRRWAPATCPQRLQPARRRAPVRIRARFTRRSIRRRGGMVVAPPSVQCLPGKCVTERHACSRSRSRHSPSTRWDVGRRNSPCRRTCLPRGAPSRGLAEGSPQGHAMTTRSVAYRRRHQGSMSVSTRRATTTAQTTNSCHTPRSTSSIRASKIHGAAPHAVADCPLGACAWRRCRFTPMTLALQ